MAQDVQKPENQTPRAMSPYASFRGEMDRLFNDFFGPDRGFGVPMLDTTKFFDDEAGIVVPNVEISDNDKRMTLSAELPGMTEGDIDLAVADGILTLKGEKKFEKTDEKDELKVTERRYGSFKRTFKLPNEAQTEKAEATFDKGVLTVTIPKKALPKTKENRIKIRAK